MDIMMPVMDGLEATKAIRQMDREDAKTVPIFAMTANAFREDAKTIPIFAMTANAFREDAKTIPIFAMTANAFREDAKTVPIFAMTANAFSEDVKKSLEAGMNEHLVKPLEEEKMIGLIARYVRKR